MFATRSEYDRGVNTFSPEGRLFQVEYAIGAVKLGATAVGVWSKEGVVLASERRVTSTLMEPRSVEKIFEVDRHVGCASSGLIADARTLIDHARVEAQNHHFTYDERMSVESVVESISDLALDFSDANDGRRKKTMSRPFGVALLVAGVDDDCGAQLWVTDPSASNTQFFAAAIGSAQEGAETMLQEQFHKNMTFREAEQLALVVLRQVMEEKLNSTNIEIAAVKTETKRFHIYSASEVAAVVETLPEPSIPTPAATLSSAGRTATAS